MKLTEIFRFLNKQGFADQVHIVEGEEYIFYAWNKRYSDLEPTVSIKNNKIERIYYSRSLIPFLFKITNIEIEYDFTENHKFVKDKR